MNRLLSLLLAALVTVLVVSGCGGDDDPTPSPAASSGGGFPVSIRHGQGTTTIPAAPKRVVALGAADVQIARALGANLVGVASNDYRPDKQWLGVSPALPSSVQQLSATEPQLERIAALKPDLILITTAQPSYSQAYKQLSAIAPVVSYRKGILEDSGDDLTRLIGRALGRGEQADALIARSQREIDVFATDHPELAGKRLVVGQWVAGKTYLVVAPDAPSTVTFARAGLRLPAEIAKLPVQAPPGVTVISEERLDLLDRADFVVLGVESAAVGKRFLAQPIVARQQVAKAGRIRFLDYTETAAVIAPNPASTSTVLRIVAKVLGER